jgi:hypothetical protein
LREETWELIVVQQLETREIVRRDLLKFKSKSKRTKKASRE